MVIKNTLTGKDIEKILMLAQEAISLNTPISNDPDSYYELYDYIEEPSPTPEEQMLIESRKEYLLNLLHSLLKPREAQIIIWRYGLGDSASLTLNEIGDKLGLTRERVRQIEAKAMRKLRLYFVRNHLTQEDI